MWLEKFLIPALLTLTTALCSYMVHVLKDGRKVNNANAAGTRLLLRRQLVADHKKYVIKGEPMSHFVYEDITEIHDAYKALGGNGLTDKMYDELHKIDIAGEEA